MLLKKRKTPKVIKVIGKAIPKTKQNNNKRKYGIVYDLDYWKRKEEFIQNKYVTKEGACRRMYGKKIEKLIRNTKKEIKSLRKKVDSHSQKKPKKQPLQPAGKKLIQLMLVKYLSNHIPAKNILQLADTQKNINRIETYIKDIAGRYMIDRVIYSKIQYLLISLGKKKLKSYNEVIQRIMEKQEKLYREKFEKAKRKQIPHIKSIPGSIKPMNNNPKWYR